ncbi:MAG: hypothetical protein Q9P14_11050 [candidate division KSB1 bacterium]|nr:hypothetical protein [candidate division KSB1 bacterium]
MDTRGKKSMGTTPKEGLSENQKLRRRLVNFFLGGGILTTFGSVIFPIVNYLIPPKVKQETTTSVIAGRVGELKPNSGKIFRFGPNRASSSSPNRASTAPSAPSARIWTARCNTAPT